MADGSGLKYGLNISSKKKGVPAGPPARKTIFDDDGAGSDEDRDENGGEEQEIESLGGLHQFSSSKPSDTSFLKNAPKSGAKSKFSVQFGDLSSKHAANKTASSAMGVDSTVYDYDAVYDTLHAKSKKAASSSQPSGPRYMANLIAAAETRKRDHLRAKDKLLAREREAEGDEFADKESFVTGAYKAQQEEVRRLEEEEERREEMQRERRAKGLGGKADFHKNLLADQERRHQEAIDAAEKVIQGEVVPEEIGDEDSEMKKEEIRLARERGAEVNEDGQVVDKRKLLKSGLNVKAKTNGSETTKAAPTFNRGTTQNVSRGVGSKQAMRERQSRMIEEQLAESAKRAAEDEEVEREARERAAKSKRTSGEVQSAKERYLARKAAAKEAVG